MVDNDFVLRFRAETQEAINQMRLLVEVALQAEAQLNRTQAAASKASGVKGSTRAAQQQQDVFKNLGIEANDLDERLEKIGGNFAASFEKNIRRLPTILGDIQLFKNANQAIPTSTIAAGIRGFRALGKVFEDDTVLATRYRTEVVKLSRELVSQKRPQIKSLLDQAQRAGSRGLTKIEIGSLRSAEREILGLGRAGINVSRTLEFVRQRLVALGQPLGLRREIQGLLPQINNLRELAAVRGANGNQSGQIRALQQLEEVLGRIEVRGGNVTRSLANVRAQIAGATAAVSATKAADSKAADVARARAAAEKARENVTLVRQSSAHTLDQEVGALKRYERALLSLRLRGIDVSRELVNLRRQILQVGGAAANTKDIDRLLRVQRRNDAAISQRTAFGQGPSRILETRGANIALELEAKGHLAASAAIAKHRAALATMPAVINAEVAALLRERDALLKGIRNREVVGLRPTANQLGAGLNINRELAKTGGTIGAQAANDFNRFSVAIDANRSKLATWDSAFGHHARRIAEGLLIYNAFGTALGAIGESFREIATLDTELARFEAVAGNLKDTEADVFLRDLSDVAISTATPLSELIKTTDLVGASFREIKDPVARAKAVSGFSDIAGQFSNVIGEEGNQEAVTQQLVALFRQTRVQGQPATEQLDRFRGFLDLVVTAGGNASSVIKEVTEGLREIGPGAKSSGADLGLLAFAMAEVIQETGESGLSIGNTFKTVLANLTVGSKVSDVFKNIPDGIVQLTDQNGNLLASTTILENLFAAVQEGSIKIGDAQEIFRDLGPVIQPGQQGVVNEIFNAIGRGLDRVKEEGPKAGNALQELNDIILDTLGKRFEQVMARFEALLVNKMADPIIAVGKTVIGVLNAIVGLLENDLIRGLVLAATQFIVLVGAATLLVGSLQKIGLFVVTARAVIAGLATPAINAAIAMRGLGTASGAVASPAAIGAVRGGLNPALVATGTIAQASATKVGFLQIAVNGVFAAVKFALPLLALMAAIDFGVSIASAIEFGDAIDSISEKAPGAKDSGSRTGFLGRELPELGNIGFEGQQQDLAALLKLQAKDTGKTLADIFDTGDTKAQAENLRRLTVQIKALNDAGNLSRPKALALIEAITDKNGDIKTTILRTEEFEKVLSDLATEEFNASDGMESFDWPAFEGGALDAAGAVDELTAAEIRAADALRTNIELSPLRGQLIAELTAQLDAGAISLDEFTSRLGNIDQASEAAANFVTLLGDHLDLIPGLVERISQSGESPAEALTRLLTANPETSGQQIELINQMIDLVETHEEVRDTIAANPIVVKPKVENSELKKGTELFFDILGIMHAKNISPIVRPKMDLGPFTAQAQKFLKLLTFLGIASSNAVGGKNFGSKSKSGGGDLSGLLDELGAIGSAIGEVGSIGPGDPRLDSAKEPPKPEQSALLDLGDLSPALVPQIIALAAAAQKRIIAAGGVADTEDTTAILKDGVFQKLVKGIDNRLLTEAMQQLTEVEKKRLELEQQRLQDVTRSIVTQVGPIQSLTSAPILAAGGGLLAGQGFNADPRLGNVTISVPINWSGMSLTQLQKFIYESISKAWIDAGRGT